MPEPIDYARAESDDDVRKKFRRRVTWFVVVTVVVMDIGFGWIDSSHGGTWQIGNVYRHPVSVSSDEGWFRVWGPERKESFAEERVLSGFGNSEVGLRVWQVDVRGFPKWMIYIRYRTLFILATIPWIITLIRLIRVWKRRRVFETEPRTQ